MIRTLETDPEDLMGNSTMEEERCAKGTTDKP